MRGSLAREYLTSRTLSDSWRAEILRENTAIPARLTFTTSIAAGDSLDRRSSLVTLGP